MFIARLAVLLVILSAVGCNILGKKPGAQARGRAPGKQAFPEEKKQMAGGPGVGRDQPLPDPVPPPAPPIDVPGIPESPPRETELVVAPMTEPAVQPVAATESNLDAIRRVHRRAAERFKTIEGFQARLTRRETIGSKAMPEEMLDLKLRTSPFAIHSKWVGTENFGRELIYVTNKYDNKVQILTGKNEGLLIPANRRFSFAPTDSQVRSKSRYDLREGGMGMVIEWFGKSLGEMEKHPNQSNRMKYLGKQSRRERESGLECVEEIVPPNWEPLMPRGGKRLTYFDPRADSPSHGLPILVIAYGDNGREVEYYWFDQFRPMKWTDADFDADRLFKR